MRSPPPDEDRSLEGAPKDDPRSDEPALALDVEPPPESPLRGAAEPVVLPFEGRDSAAGLDSAGRSFACRAQAGLTVSVTAAAAVQNVSARRVMSCS